MLQQIKLNLRRLVRGESAMSLLFVVIQLLSVMTIYFSYGLINHLETKTDAVEGITMRYSFEITEEDFISKEEIENVYDRFIPVIENKVEAMFIMGFVDNVNVITSFGYENDHFVLSPLLSNTVEPSLISGRLFNDDELQSGSAVSVTTADIYTGKEIFTIDGKEFTKIGIYDISGLTNTMYVPYKAIPDSCNVVYFSIFLTQPLLETEYNIMADLIHEYIGNKVPIPEFDGIKNASFTRVYNDLMVVTVILIVVCAFNYCIIYRYLLEKRRRTFAVSRICGCSKSKAVAIYMIELLAISIATLALGLFAYLKLLLPKAVNYFEYIEYYHTATDNLQIAIIYIACLFIVYFALVAKFVSTTPANLIRGCKK